MLIVDKGPIWFPFFFECQFVLKVSQQMFHHVFEREKNIVLLYPKTRIERKIHEFSVQDDRKWTQLDSFQHDFDEFTIIYSHDEFLSTTNYVANDVTGAKRKLRRKKTVLFWRISSLW